MFEYRSQTLSTGDAVELSLTGPLCIEVGSYGEERTVASETLELSLDGESWGPLVAIDFAPIISCDLWVRPGSASSGTVEVQSA